MSIQTAHEQVIEPNLANNQPTSSRKTMLFSSGIGSFLFSPGPRVSCRSNLQDLDEQTEEASSSSPRCGTDPDASPSPFHGDFSIIRGNPHPLVSHGTTSRSRDPPATSSSSSPSSNDDSTPHESPASDDGLCDGLDNDNSSSSAEGGEPLELPTAADFLAQAQDGLARLAVVEDSVARLFGSPSPPPPPVPLTLHVGITTHAPKKEARSDPFALIRPSVPTALRKLVLLLWTFDTGASVALDNRTLAASSSGWQRCCPADASPTDAN